MGKQRRIFYVIMSISYVRLYTYSYKEIKVNIVTIKNEDVEPPEISLFDVKEIHETSTFFAVIPSFYNVRIVFSPLVIQRMLQWSIKEGYIELEGKLSIRIRNKKGVLSVSG